jgi:hypothetical protein
MLFLPQYADITEDDLWSVKGTVGYLPFFLSSNNETSSKFLNVYNLIKVHSILRNCTFPLFKKYICFWRLQFYIYNILTLWLDKSIINKIKHTYSY